MRVTNSIYVDQRTASIPFPALAIAIPELAGGRRGTRHVSSEAVVESDFVALAEEIRSRGGADLEEFENTDRACGAVMPISQQSVTGMCLRGGSGGRARDTAWETVYASSAHYVRETQSSRENDMLHHRTPLPEGLDVRVTQRQGNGCGQSTPFGIQQHAPRSEEVHVQDSEPAASGDTRMGARLGAVCYMALGPENDTRRRVSTLAKQHRTTPSMRDGAFGGMLPQQERFPASSSPPPTMIGGPQSHNPRHAGLGACDNISIVEDSFVGGAGGSPVDRPRSQLRNCTHSKSSDFSEEVSVNTFGAGIGYHNGWNLISPSARLLQGHGAPHPSAGTHDGDYGNGHRYQQQQRQQFHAQQGQQLQATADTHPRYDPGGGGMRGGDEEYSPLAMRDKHMNYSARSPALDVGSSPLHRRSSGLAHNSMYFTGGSAAPSQATKVMIEHPPESQRSSLLHSPSSVPSHARSFHPDGHHEHEIVVATRSSGQSIIGSMLHGGGRDLSKKSSSQIEAFANGRWPNVGAVDHDGSSTGSSPGGVGGGGSAYGAVGLSPYHELPPHSEAVRSSERSARGLGIAVTRDPTPYHHHHHHHQAVDRRSGYPSGGDLPPSGGAPSRDCIDSPPAFTSLDVPSSHSPPEGRMRYGEVSPVGQVAAATFECSASPVVAVRSSVVSSAPSGSPRPVSKLPTPKNPLEWLQNLRHARTGSSEKGPATPRTSRSSSMSSLASPARFAALVGAGRGEAIARGGGGCPAPDCPGKGDCLPGATRDMVVYEVKFKRATRTFLPADIRGGKAMSCGDRVTVEADRGEDLGIVHRSLPLSEYLDALYLEKKAKADKIAENGGGGGAGRGGGEGRKKKNKNKKHEEDAGKNASKQQQQQQRKQEDMQETCPVRAMKRILRLANLQELEQLEQKAREEAQILRVCQTKVRNRSLPMKIVDAEYQFDQHKLTLFFEAERRIDFRELVRDLFAVYKTRIWMQQVKDKDKTPSVCATAGENPAAHTVGEILPGAGVVSCAGESLVPTDPSSAAALIPAHDTDHDSGYGSAGSSGEGFDSRVGGVSHRGSGSLESEASSTAGSTAFSAFWPVDVVGAAGQHVLAVPVTQHSVVLSAVNSCS